MFSCFRSATLIMAVEVLYITLYQWTKMLPAPLCREPKLSWANCWTMTWLASLLPLRGFIRIIRGFAGIDLVIFFHDMYFLKLLMNFLRHFWIFVSWDSTYNSEYFALQCRFGSIVRTHSENCGKKTGNLWMPVVSPLSSFSFFLQFISVQEGTYGRCVC